MIDVHSQHKLPACLYLHGFLSSPNSLKAQQVHELYHRQQQLDCLQIPTLAFEPERAIQQAEQCLLELKEQHSQVFIIGSSLGGYYATFLAEQHHVPAALINPAVRPFELFEDYLGANTHYHTGDVHELRMEHIDQLRELHITRLRYPQQLLLLLQTGDETLDYRQAAAYYQDCPGWLQGGGDHSFIDFIERMPLIFEHARRYG